MRRVWIGLAVVLAALAATATPATAATMCSGSGCVATTDSGGSVTTSTDTSTTDGYGSVASNGGARYCSDADYWRAGYDAFGVTQWKEHNHSHWCYYYGGNIYYRTGYDTQYVASGWHTKSHSWAKGWNVPYTSARSVAKATFDFDIAGYVAQESSTTVCLNLGDKGGVHWC
jgi:hypothetical protein